ncbi:ROK family protein [Arsenicicoccus piscis]|uniref:HTH marR-type domain-containing protein n=1 Tax=Arsenicicoccus piscis TaxID=673954 RepID=A0ABQ6HTG9_9MICO|nr:ROK family protein [Arsenicicoccus piscis]GMA17997.1 hypothetical protein GCM10025862_00180 [Arsenicicoccus piscis]GMA21711.1 hypothetical protein GCM10025862_37320 [Arsenicicoccus piscis]
MDADLLRRTTDRLVLAALLDAGQLTRAELAQRVGISRPTASESVRRLADAGLVEEAGRQQGARGRSGTYCRVVPGAGRALVAHAGPGEVVAEVVDAAAGPDESPAADRVHRHPIGSTTTVAELTTALHTLLGEVEAAHGPLPVDRVLSVADPVDSAHGRLVLLEGSPFVLDEGSLRDVIGDAGVLDNDVHWAALAERAARADAGDPVDNFLYVYLGAGLGAAVVDEGRLVTGRRGLGARSPTSSPRAPTVGRPDCSTPFVNSTSRCPARRASTPCCCASAWSTRPPDGAWARPSGAPSRPASACSTPAWWCSAGRGPTHPGWSTH